MPNFSESRTDIVIIQPPLVQLNAPYPSGAYLQAFFKRLRAERPEWNIGTVRWIDAGHLLYRAVFSAEGLSLIFSRTQQAALIRAAQAERSGSDNEAFNLRRYVSMQDQWIRWIPVVTDILSGTNRELCHEFVRSPSVPRGQRMETFLAGLEREPDADDARILASLALADLADYITAVFDPAFALVRYAESLAVSTEGFGAVEAAVHAPVLTEFYRPVLRGILDDLGLEDTVQRAADGTVLFCISCPFPGTLAASLYTGKFIKDVLANRAFVALGGGYVNTELRRTKDVRLAQFIDALSFDRGYGSYYDFFSAVRAGVSFTRSAEPLYNMRLFCTDGRDAFVLDCPGGGALESKAECITFEETCTRELVPDFEGIDFAAYPRLADSRNPMHRLWSDGTWLKAYLAHGCYWHKCSFCDTSLDYVCSYRMTDVRRLYGGLAAQAAACGVRGVHFVDEAAPPVALRAFALENLKSAQPLTFWGNIRYEKTFSRDLADLLAHGGMTGVSGGIEIACGGGLDAVCKGTDIDSIVGACAAFKEAGILTHAYMIYGYWMETPQMLVDSMETLRQLFASGLLDSAFWHKFMLTKHSRIYNEYLQGMHADLQPEESCAAEGDSVFAENTIRFKGEEKSARYTEGLTRSLDAWMSAQGLSKPVTKWFDFALPKPSVPADYIEKSIARYEARRNQAFCDYAEFKNTAASGYVWLGGKPSVVPLNAREGGANVHSGAAKKGGFQLCWTYLGEMLSADFPFDTDEQCARAVADGLYALSPRFVTERSGMAAPALTAMLSKKMYQAVRGNGLCRTLPVRNTAVRR